MADIKAFLREQARIYREQFRAREKMVKDHGLWPDSMVTFKKGGHFVAFLPDIATRWSVRDILDYLDAYALITGTPCIRYTTSTFHPGNTTVHTTITDLCVVEFNRPTLGNPVNRAMAERLSSTVERAVRSLSRTTREQCAVAYNGRLLCNNTTVIMPGKPNEEWLIVVERILAQCRAARLEVRDPWGAHMTLARVAAPHNPKQSSIFLKLVKYQRPMPIVLRPRFIGVGVFRCNAREGFVVNWHKKIRIY